MALVVRYSTKNTVAMGDNRWLYDKRMYKKYVIEFFQKMMMEFMGITRNIFGDAGPNLRIHHLDVQYLSFLDTVIDDTNDVEPLPYGVIEMSWSRGPILCNDFPSLYLELERERIRSLNIFPDIHRLQGSSYEPETAYISEILSYTHSVTLCTEKW